MRPRFEFTRRDTVLQGGDVLTLGVAVIYPRRSVYEWVVPNAENTGAIVKLVWVDRVDVDERNVKIGTGSCDDYKEMQTRP